ncbi:MAG: hypothetical protein N2450_06710 [bacterium]|nr:hypothetical protein [bacterium]
MKKSFFVFFLTFSLSIGPLLSTLTFAADDEYDDTRSSRKKQRRYSSSVVYFGPSSLYLKEAEPSIPKDAQFKGFGISLSDINWNKPVFTSFILTYRSASATNYYDMMVDTSSGFSRYQYREQGSVETSIIMPEVSWTLETNLLALSAFKNSLPQFENIDFLLGAGFSINYAPFLMDMRYNVDSRTTVSSTPPYPNKYTKNEWYWHHITWSYHFIGGIMMDESLGGTAGIYFSEPFSGKKPRFGVHEIRFGVCYSF